MKTLFNYEYLLAKENRGCFTKDMVTNLFNGDTTQELSLEYLFDTISLHHFMWFYFNGCEATVEEKQDFTLHCVKDVMHLWQDEYPNDNRGNGLLAWINDYKAGKCELQELIISQNHLRNAYWKALEDKAPYYTSCALWSLIVSVKKFTLPSDNSYPIFTIYASQSADRIDEFRQNIKEYLFD